MDEYPVLLVSYDMSGGMAKQLSKQLVGTEIEAIWHTSIIVHNRELHYGDEGILTTVPGEYRISGNPGQISELGKTQVDEETLDDFLREAEEFYSKERYDLLDFNCNTFTNFCSVFLTGNAIPQHLQDSGLQSPLLRSLITPMLPMLQSMYRNARNQRHGGNIANVDDASYANAYLQHH